VLGSWHSLNVDMKHTKRLLIIALVATACISVFASGKPKPIEQYTGEFYDEISLDVVPQVITNSKVFYNTWKLFNISSEKPEVDFDKHIVVVTIWKGSQFSPSYHIDGNGILKTTVIGTMDIRIGLRYALAVFEREGINGVEHRNGKFIESLLVDKYVDIYKRRSLKRAEARKFDAVLRPEHPKRVKLNKELKELDDEIGYLRDEIETIILIEDRAKLFR